MPAETANHIPVEEIAGRAFASRADLEELILPESIRCIRSFAFHNCAHLHYVKLSDSVVDYYDGALRQCPELQDIELTLHTPGHFRLLKELVGDSDAMLPLTIHLPMGATAALTFPSYADNYQEDTMARAIHEHIEGPATPRASSSPGPASISRATTASSRASPTTSPRVRLMQPSVV